MIRKVTNGYLTVGILTGVVAMTAWADIALSTDELVTVVIAKSLQSPVFLSFWLLWGGLAIVPLSMFVKRRLSRVTMVVIGVLMLTIGFVVGVEDYNRCGRCGTKLKRIWISLHVFYGCPKCNRHKLYGTCKECGKEFERFNRVWMIQRKEAIKDGVNPDELCNACIELHDGHVR